MLSSPGVMLLVLFLDCWGVAPVAPNIDITVHAPLPQALRMAYDMHFDASFGDVLLAADRITEQQHQAARGGTQSKAKWSTAPTAATAAAAQVQLPTAAASRTVLLRQPRVFALAVVWESPQVRWGLLRLWFCLCLMG